MNERRTETAPDKKAWGCCERGGPAVVGPAAGRSETLRTRLSRGGAVSVGHQYMKKNDHGNRYLTTLNHPPPTLGCAQRRTRRRLSDRRHLHPQPTAPPFKVLETTVQLGRISQALCERGEVAAERGEAGERALISTTRQTVGLNALERFRTRADVCTRQECAWGLKI